MAEIHEYHQIPMLVALQKKDWKAFARLYNGLAYAQNRYDEKLSTAYSSFNKQG